MADTNGNGGAKAFGGIMAVLALIGAIASVMLPTNERLDEARFDIHELRSQIAVLRETRIQMASLKTGMDALKEEFRDHEKLDGHQTAVAKYAAMSESLREVETQFRHQDRMIRLLWSKVYGQGTTGAPAVRSSAIEPNLDHP